MKVLGLQIHTYVQKLGQLLTNKKALFIWKKKLLFSDGTQHNDYGHTELSML